MNAKRAAVAGLVGTVVMTALMLLAPLAGLPQLAIGSLLSTLLALSSAYLPTGPAVGWTLHAAFGIALALVYAGFFVSRLPGGPAGRGALFGFIVFLIAQVTFMPLVGAGFFSRGNVPMLLGALIGHLVYGGVVGAIYGEPAPAAGGSMSPKAA
jgi:uncharacterized membrane protein YagU involved in acid resistance